MRAALHAWLHAHQLLQLMYSQQVPPDASQELLLQMLRLADRYQAGSCTDLLLARLLALSKVAVSPVLMGSVASLPSALHSREDFKALFQACYDVAVGKLW